MTIKVSIIFDDVPPYREAFYNQLNDALGGNLTVYTPKKNNALKCNQQVFEVTNILGTFHVAHFPMSHLGDADVIVMMFNLRWSLLYKLTAHKFGNLILWGHGVGSRKWLNRFKAALINRSLGFISYEPAGCQAFIEKGVSSSKLAYMGNTIEVLDHQLSDKKREYFLYLGRLQQRKRLDAFIRAFAMLPKSMQERSGVMIMGDGELRSSLIDLTKKVGILDYCSFVPGSYDARVVKRYLDRAIAYVSPGHVGLGVLHAFSSGVPVITRRLAPHAPEVENIVDGLNGFLTGSRDVDLANAMKVYLNSQVLHRRHCVEAYSRYANHRTMQMMVQRFESALREMYKNR